jgi:hypothetical protein
MIYSSRLPTIYQPLGDNFSLTQDEKPVFEECSAHLQRKERKKK